MSEQLRSKTTVQLRLIARDLDIQGRSSMRKAQLVEAIAQHVEKVSTPPADSAQASIAGGFYCPALQVTAKKLLHHHCNNLPRTDVANHNEQPTADPGLPLPEHYNHNRLQLMVQDPHHLHAYWEVDPGQVDRLQQHVGGHLVLVVFSGENQQEIRRVDVTSGGYYLAVAGGRTYSAELALQDTTGRLVSLLRLESY